MIKKSSISKIGMASLTFFSLNVNAGGINKGANILLIVADDMNFNAVGAFGCPVPNTTPNIDKLASQGIRFTHAHVTSAVCQPSRGAIMTGMYGLHSGIEGFEHYTGNSLTLTEYLRNAGYMTGMLGKVTHSIPKYAEEYVKFDLVKDQDELGFGRDPRKYYEFSKLFFLKAKNEKKPFFMMANSHDSHRPFAGSDDEKKAPGFAEALEKSLIPNPSKIFKPEEVVVPGFLPDIPGVRKEVAQYYSSVRRCDDTVGEVLRDLQESGLYKNTLIIFISDNGMSFPYSKTNCYLNSTRTPFIAQWTGVIKHGTDIENFISGIDFLPTFLEIAGVPIPKNIDGTSFLPLLKGEKQEGRDKVFTQFYETSGKKRYPMRAMQNSRFGYIFNPWSDGQRIFRNESQAGLTFNAMKEAAVQNKGIKQRVDFFLLREVEEFYDFEKDPDALHNLISDPLYTKEINGMRNEMRNWMIKNNDFALSFFEQRNSKEALQKFMEEDEVRTIQRRDIKTGSLQNPNKVKKNNRKAAAKKNQDEIEN